VDGEVYAHLGNPGEGNGTVSDRAGFLRAIIAQPGDDLPRTIFADWLDERGHG
jgi:uncharacterized protein (TIGR02996 family)